MVLKFLSLAVILFRPLKKFWQCRRLGTTSFSFSRRAYNLACIDLALLRQNGIRGVILDLDNTIVSEDDRYLSPGAEAWIEQAQQEGMQLFILSNGKRRYRVVLVFTPRCSGFKSSQETFSICFS